MRRQKGEKLDETRWFTVEIKEQIKERIREKERKIYKDKL